MPTQPPNQNQPPRPAARTKWPWCVALALALLSGLWAWLDVHYRPVLTEGPLIQISDTAPANAKNTISIVWGARCRWQPAGPGSTGMICLAESVDAAKAGAWFGTDGPYFSYPLFDLPPGRTFHYTLWNRGFFGRAVQVGGPYEFITPPQPAAHFRFLAFGDSGNGSHTQRGVAETMIAAKPDLIIHLGDLVYPIGAARDYRPNFFDPYREMISRIAFMPSIGNHDIVTRRGQPYLDAFVLPKNGPTGVEPERNYWFDFGDARFVALDTNRTIEGGAISEGDMRTHVAPWLRDVLRSAPTRWKFVFFHHPPYTGGTHHPASSQTFVKEIFVPIFDETHVDAVFCGHNHLYERTKPIHHDRVVPPGAGVLYIVSGAGGVSRYPELKPPPDYIAAFNNSVFSFTQVDLSPDRFELKQIDEKGGAIDSFVVTKSPTHSPI